MALGISGLIAAYILLAALLLSVNLYSKWSWQLKTITIIITSVFFYRFLFFISTITRLANKSEITRAFQITCYRSTPT